MPSPPVVAKVLMMVVAKGLMMVLVIVWLPRAPMDGGEFSRSQLNDDIGNVRKR
jgi:hypothetical protein